MWGIYCWRDLNIYLVLFWALLENKNQLHSKTWWWRGNAFEGEFVSIFLSWTTFIKKYTWQKSNSDMHIIICYLTTINWNIFSKHNINMLLFSNNFLYVFELTTRHNLFLVPCLDEESFKVCFSSEKSFYWKTW